jgi:glycosyltransferase involved in cell wall biosynthesis
MYHEETREQVAITFCIITGGSRPELIGIVLESIRAQGIAAYEVIVAGNFHPEPGLVYLEALEAAAAGRLGELRNLAVARARYENIVLLDDDIVLSRTWYANFSSYAGSFDILTSQVRTPDGSRYCDHVTLTSTGKHRILAENEDAASLYMTGGGGWVMKDYVARQVTWDQERLLNQGEDVDFSRRCQERGFRIAHNHAMLVFHADASYTCLGRTALRRQEGRSQAWAATLLGERPARAAVVRLVLCYWFSGQRAEAADLLRVGRQGFPCDLILTIMWWALVARSGGRLPGSCWFAGGDPEYLDTLARYRENVQPRQENAAGPAGQKSAQMTE